MKCEVCRDEKRIRLPLYYELDVMAADQNTIPDVSKETWRDFDCPQCSMVPFRRVSAAKAEKRCRVEEFYQIQTAIQRQLASRIGDFLLREDCVTFTSVAEPAEGMVAVRAEIYVVGPDDAKKVRVADLAERNFKLELQRREQAFRLPKPEPVSKSEFDKRFSGLDIK